MRTLALLAGVVFFGVASYLAINVVFRCKLAWWLTFTFIGWDAETKRIKRKGCGLWTRSLLLTLLGYVVWPVVILLYIVDSNIHHVKKNGKRIVDKNGTVKVIQKAVEGWEAVSAGMFGLDRKSALTNYLEEFIHLLPLSDMFMEFEVEFIGEVEHHHLVAFEFGEMPKEVLSKVESSLGVMFKTDTFMYAVGFVAVMYGIGLNPIIAMVALVFVAMIYGNTPDREPPEIKFSGENGRFNGRDGVYRVLRKTWTLRRPIGAAYAEDGVLVTLYHVTNGQPITHGGVRFDMSVASVSSDFAAYGGVPTVAKPEDKEELYIEILSPYCDRMVPVRSVAHYLQDGRLTFPHIQTDYGVCGSPMFVVRHGTLVYAGPMGTTVKRSFGPLEGSPENWQVGAANHVGEMTSAHKIKVTPRSLVQCFSYPGAGKTRTVVPRVVEQGLGFCQKVFVAGPTRTVAEELYHALHKCPQGVTLATFGHKTSRGARVVCTAHASLLSMLLDPKGPVPSDAGFIIDEAHMNDKATKALLMILRHRIRVERSKGFLLEMTATGFDLESKTYAPEYGSNHDIEDIKFTGSVADHAVKVARSNPSKRIIIFAPTVMGRQGTHAIAAHLKNAGVSQPVVTLNRDNFQGVTPFIKERMREPMIIVSTSISECGANFNVDICIDSGKQLRFMKKGDFVNMEIGVISEAQMIQRRGRVGRQRPGEYHSPADLYPESGSGPQHESTNTDRDIIRKALGIEYKFENEMESDSSLSKAQLLEWIRGNKGKDVASSETLKLLYSPTGVAYSDPAMRAKDSLVCRPDEAVTVVRVGDLKLPVRWWDERDKDLLIRLLGQAYTRKVDIVYEEREIPEVPVSNYVAEHEEILVDERSLVRMGSKVYRMTKEPQMQFTLKKGWTGDYFEATGRPPDLEEIGMRKYAEE